MYTIELLFIIIMRGLSIVSVLPPFIVVEKRVDIMVVLREGKDNILIPM
jgi:hypothetical protein